MRHNLSYPLRYLSFLAVILSFVAACATDRPIPQTPGQTVIDAYGTLEKAAVVTTVLLQQGVIDARQAKARRDDIVGAKAALDAASAAIHAGDLSTAIGKLQAAQVLVDTLARYVADNQGVSP